MPLTKKGVKIKRNFVKQYGKKLGESYFYASINEGKITDAESTKKKKKNKKNR